MTPQGCVSSSANSKKHNKMTNDRKHEEHRPGAGTQEPVKNPFKQPEAAQPEPSAGEEADAEQQRKEALTERD
ncbi:hypothetical protein GCM10023184_10380 [Flaviaesturariibacter amylovorans]|uniref:Uncharacterized protein n=2 Tax=Flaviaesturariibacter amylovorans TaxID=1084520 RepID=A0ABP8GFP5_9BACT